MPTLKVIPLVALALLLPLITVGAANAAQNDLPAPTNTTAVSVVHQQQVPPQPVVSGIRLARHADYDRVVFDISGAMPDYSVRYVPAIYTENGAKVPMNGTAVLAVSLHSVDIGHAPAVPARTGLPSIRDIKVFDQFEGHLGYGIGISDRNGFRVLELRNPTRLVIDVAHDLPAPTDTAPRYSPLGDSNNAALTAIHTAAHPTYDRVVFQFQGPDTGLRYVVSYQGALLRVDLEHGTVGAPTYTGPWNLNPGLTQLRTIRLATASTDGTTVLLTLHHTAGFRVLQLRSPDRIVVDVAH
ncbi:MAG TPA: hypothetical protein VGL06_23835 [Pseudonocardiaceae bacterium]